MMDFTSSGFDWDHGNRKKCQSHGVSIAEIESVFRRPVTLFPDHRHSKSEERLKAIGTSTTGRHVLVVFTVRRRRDETLIRTISARYMHRREIGHYEEQKAKVEETARSQDR
jgi:uncharacterized DUF497 family protein